MGEEDKDLSQEKHMVSHWFLEDTWVHTCKLDMSWTTESLATIDRMNIDILPAERDLSNGLVQENDPRHLDASNELEVNAIFLKWRSGAG